ncbi:MAG: threonine synthase [Oscillospiraceae bacterium]
MRYLSTRNKDLRVTASQAIAQGLSRDGGLFVPETLPKLAAGAIPQLCKMTYKQRAVYIMESFLEGFSVAELSDFTDKAYSPAGFDTPEIAPVYTLDDRTHFLELWHGPTCAFKDMALQILPYLLTASMKKNGNTEKVCILVATSGDTGKAALEGFADVEGTKIMVFYPRDGVSDIQKLQMVSQSGANVGVCAVNGNFDDAQTGVKVIFSDESLRERLAARGWSLSSANSINWGRLLPQIVYYVSAYCDLIGKGSIAEGDPVNFCVPTGNFGDILAGFYAKQLGIPIKKLICASNKNDVLTDFIKTGVYDKNRSFYTTISPSMDILVSSNLERLIFNLSGGDDKLTAEYMSELAKDGKYQISDKIKSALDMDFAAGFCTDEETKCVIGDTFSKNGYLIDTHTAVAYGVLEKYREETGDNTVTVVVSTASPYKFCDSVLEALGSAITTRGCGLISQLEEVSGVCAPAPLKSLASKTVRFNQSSEKDELMSVVESFLK